MAKKIEIGSNVIVVKPDRSQYQRDIPHHLRWDIGDTLIVHSITEEEGEIFVRDIGGNGLNIKRVKVVEEE